MNEQYIKDQIKELFGGGQLYCAETTVKLLAEAGGRESAQAVAMATGFCSGAARTCGQCGAVSGAIMGLGLYAGRTEPGGDYDAVYTMVQEFIERYTERFGSLNCYELTGCDFRVAEDQKRFKEEQIVHKCFDMVAFAVEAGLDILGENGYLTNEQDQEAR